MYIPEEKSVQSALRSRPQDSALFLCVERVACREAYVRRPPEVFTCPPPLPVGKSSNHNECISGYQYQVVKMRIGYVVTNVNNSNETWRLVVWDFGSPKWRIVALHLRWHDFPMLSPISGSIPPLPVPFLPLSLSFTYTPQALMCLPCLSPFRVSLSVVYPCGITSCSNVCVSMWRGLWRGQRLQRHKPINFFFSFFFFHCFYPCFEVNRVYFSSRLQPQSIAGRTGNKICNATSNERVEGNGMDNLHNYWIWGLWEFVSRISRVHSLSDGVVEVDVIWLVGWRVFAPVAQPPRLGSRNVRKSPPLDCSTIKLHPCCTYFGRIDSSLYTGGYVQIVLNDFQKQYCYSKKKK